MSVKGLEDLYDYSYWANERLFQVLTQLTPEQFIEPVAGSNRSIRNTMVHVLSTEWGWLDRCGGPKRGARLDPDEYPTAESVIKAFNQVESYAREFLRKLKDEDLSRMVEYSADRGEKRSMPLGELLQHTANHSVHHRGQVALLLRMLGHAPGYFDMLIYYAEKRGVPAW
jgi:uncharacterized damage-inducible protein DinB